MAGLGCSDQGKLLIRVSLQLGELMRCTELGCRITLHFEIYLALGLRAQIMSRPDIPESIKRQVRQECHFGCVLCGMPFFQYDHISEYANNPIHEASNLALLCPNHHASKTTGKLSAERIRQAKSNPYNSTREFTTGYSVESSQHVHVAMGSNQSSCTFPKGNGQHHALWVNGTGFLTLTATDHWLTISMLLTDTTGNPLLKVLNGELTVTTAAWDYTYEGRKLKVKGTQGVTLLDLELTNDYVKVNQGAFLCQGGDGFVVEDPVLYSLMSGKCIGVSIQGRATQNQTGSWGLLNSKRHPEIQPPGGFGFFRCG
jgi:hypothetical protein